MPGSLNPRMEQPSLSSSFGSKRNQWLLSMLEFVKNRKLWKGSISSSQELAQALDRQLLFGWPNWEPVELQLVMSMKLVLHEPEVYVS